MTNSLAGERFPDAELKSGDGGRERTFTSAPGRSGTFHRPGEALPANHGPMLRLRFEAAPGNVRRLAERMQAERRWLQGLIEAWEQRDRSLPTPNEVETLQRQLLDDAIGELTAASESGGILPFLPPPDFGSASEPLPGGPSDPAAGEPGEGMASGVLEVGGASPSASVGASGSGDLAAGGGAGAVGSGSGVASGSVAAVPSPSPGASPPAEDAASGGSQ